jgi:hypothetical protein
MINELEQTPSKKEESRLDKIVKKASSKRNPSEFIRFHYSNVKGETVEVFAHPRRLEKTKGHQFLGTFAELNYLAEKLGLVNGMNLTFPNTHAARELILSEEAEPFRKNSPSYFQINNNSIIRKTSLGDYEVRKVSGVKFENGLEIRRPLEVIEDEKGYWLTDKECKRLALQMIFVTPKATQRITNTPIAPAYFGEFKGVIPQGLELTQNENVKTRGFFHCWSFDEYGLSTIISRCNNDGYFHLQSEPCAHDREKFVFYTKENPKK